MTRTSIRTKTATVALLALAAGISAPGGVLAGEPGNEDLRTRLLLIPVQRGPNVPSVIPGRVFEYFNTVLGMNQRLLVMKPDTLVEPEPDATPALQNDPILAKGDAALDEAKELVNKKELMPAVAKFKEAMGLYEQRFAYLVDFDRYVDAALGVALANFFAEKNKEGEDAMARVVVLRPDMALDRRILPEAAVTAAERLRALYGGAEIGSVEVTTKPPEAEVFLDGVSKGAGKVKLGGMYRGKHVLRVACDGYLPRAREIMASSQHQKLEITLEPIAKEGDEGPPANPESLAKAAATGAFDADFIRMAQSVAKKYGLDAIMLSYVRRTPDKYEIAPFLFDANVGQLAELEWIELDHEISDLQIGLLVLEERLLQALAVFPRTRILRAKSEIYQPAPGMEPAAATPAPTPTPAPAPAPTSTTEPATTTAAPSSGPTGAQASSQPEPAAPAPAPTPVVPQAAPAPRPAAVTPTPAPAPTTTVMAPPRVVDDGSGGLGSWDTPASGSQDVNAWQVEEPDDEEWYEKWWVWAIVGGVAAGGAAAAYLYFNQEDHQSSGFRTVVTW